jgi:small subunit ribosomal protein S4
MARHTGPVCRLCRRERMKLYLKGEKCLSAKCVLEKKDYPPGPSGRLGRQRKASDFSTQLREKQKARRHYGVLERSFRRAFRAASAEKGITGENLLRLMERRLDNALFRMGFATSRRQARQLVRHGHVRVDGRKVDFPSYLVRPGQTVSLSEKGRDLVVVRHSIEFNKARGVPGWLDVDPEKRTARVVSLPTRDAVDLPIQEQLIVELYSK